MEKTISIIIATYNRARFLHETVDSFIKQDFPKDKYEIIIVDNKSTDETKKVVEKFKNNKEKAHVRYIYEGRAGNHFARNTAAKKAKHAILYFADDDVIADPQLLREIIKPFEIDDKVATVTGRILPKWEIEPPKWVKKYCQNSLLSLMDPPEDLIITHQLNFLYSCHQAVRKDIFFQSEGFNPEQFGGVVLGDGEAGLNAKIRELGFKFAYNGQSVTYHVVPPRRMTQQYLNRRIGISGSDHAYREYRRVEPSSLKLFFMTLKLLFISIPIHFLTYVFKILFARDFHLARFFIAYTFYYRNWVNYNIRLMKSPRWRAFVLKRDWLSNDTPLDDEIKEYINR